MLKVFVVGNKKSQETNSWLHMTDCEETAKALAEGIQGGLYREVPPKNLKPRHRNRRKGK